MISMREFSTLDSLLQTTSSSVSLWVLFQVVLYDHPIYDWCILRSVYVVVKSFPLWFSWRWLDLWNHQIVNDPVILMFFIHKSYNTSVWNKSMKLLFIVVMSLLKKCISAWVVSLQFISSSVRIKLMNYCCSWSILLYTPFFSVSVQTVICIHSTLTFNHLPNSKFSCSFCDTNIHDDIFVQIILVCWFSFGT